MDREAKKAKDKKVEVKPENKNIIKSILEAKQLYEKKVISKPQYEALKNRLIKN